MAVVLVIDPCDAFRETMEYGLPKFGHAPIGAADGRAGIALALDRVVDVALIDLEYPAMRGLVTCANFRREPELSRIATILMVPRISAEAETWARAVGANALVPKPFEWAELLALLARFVPVRC